VISYHDFIIFLQRTHLPPEGLNLRQLPLVAAMIHLKITDDAARIVADQAGIRCVRVAGDADDDTGIVDSAGGGVAGATLEPVQEG